MTCPRIALVGAPVLLVLGLVVGLVVASAAVPAAITATAGTPGLLAMLSELELSEAQRQKAAVLVENAGDRLERLERAWANNGQHLRAAELERPFDAAFVNQLVARQAELMAYIRGTESRVVAEIGALLSAEQHTRFTHLRMPSETTPGARRPRPHSRWACWSCSSRPRAPS